MNERKRPFSFDNSFKRLIKFLWELLLFLSAAAKMKKTPSPSNILLVDMFFSGCKAGRDFGVPRVT